MTDRSPYRHDRIDAVGVLLANLGTPDEPTTPALRRYLRQFLSDPRVIEVPRWKWKIILELFILTTRPKKSAAAYRSVWTDEGSPLLVTSIAQRAALEQALRERIGGPLHVALGMRYGNPSMESAFAELERRGCTRILLLPLYPQYCAATTASTVDAFAGSLLSRRWLPEARTVNGYADHPAYIEALAASVRDVWQREGEPARLLCSFHGIPERYFRAGDPYHCVCHKTARLLREALELPEERLFVSFQSRFGKEPWLQPYTDETLRSWAESGVRSVDVICPGFAADCLETIEEIDVENRGYFEAGGGRYRYIRALNARPDHIAALADIALSHLSGWVVPPDRYDEVAARREALERCRRARALGADPAAAPVDDEPA